MLNTEEILKLAHAERVSEIITLCEKSLKEEVIKSRGGAKEVTRYKAALKILNEDKMKRWGAYVEDGKQYFTNGFIAFELNNPIENLPLPENKCDIKRFFNVAMSDYEQVDKPDVAELKVKYKMAKAEKAAGVINKNQELYALENGKYVYENQNRKWGCSIENFLKIIDIMGEDFEFYLPLHSSLITAIIENEKGRALLVPINLDVTR